MAAMASGYNAKDASAVPDALLEPWRISGVTAGGMSQFLPLPRCKAIVYSEMIGTCKLLLPGVKYFLFTTPQRLLCATVPEMSRNSAWLHLYLSGCCAYYIFIH